MNNVKKILIFCFWYTLLVLVGILVGLALTKYSGNLIYFFSLILLAVFIVLGSGYLLYKITRTLLIATIYSTLFLFVAIGLSFFQFQEPTSNIKVRQPKAGQSISTNENLYQLDNTAVSGFSTKLENPENGYYQIAISFHFNSKVKALYQFSAQLFSQDKKWWESKYLKKVLPDGNDVVTLSFPSKDSAERMFSGFYTVKNLDVKMIYPYKEINNLEEVSFDSAYNVVSNRDADIYQTPVFNWENLYTAEAMPVTLASLDFETVDYDKNGKFDLLLIKPIVNVRQDGEYFFDASLEPNVPEIVSPPLSLKLGQQTIIIPIWGVSFRERGVNGHYTLKSLSARRMDGKGESLLVSSETLPGRQTTIPVGKVFQTPSYKATDFDNIMNYSSWSFPNRVGPESSFYGSLFSFRYPKNYELADGSNSGYVIVATKEKKKGSVIPVSKIQFNYSQLSYAKALDNYQGQEGVTAERIVLDGTQGKGISYVSSDGTKRRLILLQRENNWILVDIMVSTDPDLKGPLSNVIWNEFDFNNLFASFRWK